MQNSRITRVACDRPGAGWNYDLFSLLRKRHIRRGFTMNRNVTISLGALIVIIIIVALIF